MRLQCVYCGASMPVTEVLWLFAPRGEQRDRLVFEDQHETTCGPKAVAIIGGLES